MKQIEKPIYETYAKNGKLVFKITEGEFAGVEYVYESAKLNGEISYKIKNGKSTISKNNKILFENTIRKIIADKLKKI